MSDQISSRAAMPSFDLQKLALTAPGIKPWNERGNVATGKFVFLNVAKEDGIKNLRPPLWIIYHRLSLFFFIA